MSNVLIRGLSPKIYRRIQKMAEAKNASVNRTLLNLIYEGVERADTEEEKRQREAEAFRRIDELREDIYRKYGRSDDSTKLIREDRESH